MDLTLVLTNDSSQNSGYSSFPLVCFSLHLMCYDSLHYIELKGYRGKDVPG